MRFVEGNHAIEILAQPRDDLVDTLDAGLAVLVFLGVGQRRIGGKQYALFRADLAFDFPLQQQTIFAEAHPFGIALRVGEQWGILADPDRFLAPAIPVVQDDPGDLGALADAGAIADKEAASLAVRQYLLMRLPGIRDCFQLRGGQSPLIHDIGGQFRAVVERRELDRPHRGRLGKRRRVRLGAFE